MHLFFLRCSCVELPIIDTLPIGLHRNRAVDSFYNFCGDRGPVGKWKKRIGRTEDDNCRKCGVQETGWHLVFECPVNKEAREAKITGARTWEDLEDKARIRKGGWKVEAFFGKVISSKGWG